MTELPVEQEPAIVPVYRDGTPQRPPPAAVLPSAPIHFRASSRRDLFSDAGPIDLWRTHSRGDVQSLLAQSSDATTTSPRPVAHGRSAVSFTDCPSFAPTREGERMSMSTSTDPIPALRSEQPEEMLAQFRKANNWRKAQTKKYSDESDQAMQDRLYQTIINYFALGATKANIEMTLGVAAGGLAPAVRMAHAIGRGVLEPGQPGYESLPWGQATCEHRLAVLYRAFFGAVEVKQVIAQIGKGMIIQGTRRFTDFVDNLNSMVQATQGAVSEHEHKRRLVDGANKAKPKGEEWYAYKSMHAYLDEMEGDMSLAQLVQAGIEHEARLLAAALRTGLPSSAASLPPSAQTTCTRSSRPVSTRRSRRRSAPSRRRSRRRHAMRCKGALLQSLSPHTATAGSPRWRPRCQQWPRRWLSTPPTWAD